MTIIQKICCFYLFAKILLYLCPDDSYEAYFSLLLNWTLFFLIVTGIFLPGGEERLLRQGEETWRDMLSQMERFREGIDEDLLSGQIRSVVDEEWIAAFQGQEDEDG